MLTQIAEGIASASIARGVGIAASLTGTGLMLMGALFFWFLVWRAARVMLDSRDSLAEFWGDLILKLAVAAIAYWLLQATIYTTFIQAWLWQGFKDLAAQAIGMSSALPGTGPLATLEMALDEFRDGVIGALTKAEDSLGTGLGPIAWLTSFMRNKFLAFVVGALVMTIIAVAKALAVGAFCIGAVMFGVGAALGPLFIPLLLSDRLENYFWSWFRFLLVSAATLLVAVIVVLLLADAVRPLAAPGGGVSSEFGGLVNTAHLNSLDFLTTATKAIVIALFLAYVLAQIPEITNALFSGSTAGIRSGTGAAAGLIARGARHTWQLNRRLPPPFGRGGPSGGGRGGGGSGRGGGRPGASSGPAGAPATAGAAGVAAGAASSFAVPNALGVPRSVAVGATPTTLSRTGVAEASAAPARPAASFERAPPGEADSRSAHWLERSETGTPVASSREAIDRAAAAGDPGASQLLRLRESIARAADLAQRRREARAARSLKRVSPTAGGEGDA